MTIKSLQDFINDLIADILTLEPKFTSLADLTKYSRIRNATIAFAKELMYLQDIEVQTYNDIFIKTASEESLNNKLLDNGLKWGEATKSSVLLRIGSKTQPSGIIAIPQLFVVSTDELVPKTFQTIESGSITPSTPQDSKGYYTVVLSAESILTGADKNVSSETITKIVSNIAGIDVVWNETLATGGQDRESIESVRNRLLTQLQVFDRGTKSWFISKAKSFSFIKDAYVTPSPHGNGTVLLSLVGYGSLSPEQIQEVQNWFEQESIADAGAWTLFIQEIVEIPININATIYRTTLSINDTIITNATNAFFNETILVGKDFVLSKYAGMLTNIDGIYDAVITTPSSNVVISGNEIAKLNSLAINYILSSED